MNDALRTANAKLVGALDMVRETLKGGNVQDLLFIISEALSANQATLEDGEELGCVAHGLPHPCEACAIEVGVRDEIAIAALPAVLREFHEGNRAGEFGCPPDWRDGVAAEAYALADAMLKARFA